MGRKDRPCGRVHAAHLVNYVLLGADGASFHDGFRIADGDRIAIDVKSHGVAFDNEVRYVSPARLA